MTTSPLSKVIHHLRRAVVVRARERLSDGELLESFITERDESAFEALVQRHGPMVMGVCRRVIGNAHDAEDAFQATFLVLVRKAATVLPREAVGNWLYGVAYRTGLEARARILRRHTREKQVLDMPHPRVVPVCSWHDLQPLLDQELNRLPDKYRMPIVLCDLEGRSRKDVARQLRLPEGTLSSRLATARRTLARRLSGHGLALSGGSLALILSQHAAAASVPLPLVTSTVKAAALWAAGKTANKVISAQVAALTDGVLKALFMTKLKMTAMMLLVLGLVMGSVLLPPSHADSHTNQPAAMEVAGTPPVQDLPQPAEEEAQTPQEPAKDGATLGGTLLGVNPEQNTITVKVGTNLRQTGGVDKAFELAKDLVILRDGSESRIGDLKKGVRVTVTLAADQKTALRITVLGRTMSAQLKSMDPANNTLTISQVTARTGERKDITHELAQDVKVLLPGGKEGTLTDLRSGNQVTLTFSAVTDRHITKIERPGR